MQWEWRAFGRISDEFEQRFEALPMARSWQQVRDAYFLLPNSDWNLKLRNGAEDGLKLKRRLRIDGDLELWTDSLDDLWLMPMRAEELAALGNDIGLALPLHGHAWLDRIQLLDLLSQSTPKAPIVVVDKMRTTHRMWDGGGAVLVEVVEITRPERLQSIAVQNAIDLDDEDEATVQQARQTVARAIEELGLTSGNWKTCAYVDALTTWQQGRELGV